MALPLHALLATAIDTFGASIDRRSLELCSNLLCHISSDGATARALQIRSRTTKRTVDYGLGRATRAGYVTAGRATIHLTAKGTEVAGLVSSALARSEPRWSHALRAGLIPLVEQLDLELAHFPVGYGPADHSVTGGGYRLGTTRFDPAVASQAAEDWEAGSGGRLHVGNVGVEWKPVQREAPPDELSTLALLSQCLLAFSIDYEASGGLPLAVAANVVRHIPDDGIEIKTWAARGDGASPTRRADHWMYATLERHSYASVEPHHDNPRRARLVLTEKGASARDAHETVPAVVERRWRHRYGSAVMIHLRNKLEMIATDREDVPIWHTMCPEADVPATS